MSMLMCVLNYMALLKAINDMSLLRYHIEDISPVLQGTDIIEIKRPCGTLFSGWGGGIRTHAYSSQSAVSYRLTTPQWAVWSLECGVFTKCINHNQSSFFLLKKAAKSIDLATLYGVGKRIRTVGLQGHNLAL
jgi:hypothetical protein